MFFLYILQLIPLLNLIKVKGMTEPKVLQNGKARQWFKCKLEDRNRIAHITLLAKNTTDESEVEKLVSFHLEFSPSHSFITLNFISAVLVSRLYRFESLIFVFALYVIWTWFKLVWFLWIPPWPYFSFKLR